MNCVLVFIIASFISVLDQARAVENIPTTSYNEADPANSDIPNWDSGWTQPAVEPNGYIYTTGWNYVGMVNGASGTYLGYGWVLTAAHVGSGTFTLGGSDYPVVANSVQQVGNTDLTLFKISPFPSLLPLTFRSNDPTPYTSLVAMIGYGDGGSKTSETWGYNTVTEVNQSITPTGFSYVSNDFFTLTGFSRSGNQSANNAYQVIGGDSGGGDFIYNNMSKIWELAGINEVNGTTTYSNGSTQDFSGFIQLDTYAGQIEAIISPVIASDSPTMPPWALMVLAILIFLAASKRSLPRYIARTRRASADKA